MRPTGISFPGRHAPRLFYRRQEAAPATGDFGGLFKVANILLAPINVRFGGKADMVIALRNVR